MLKSGRTLSTPDSHAVAKALKEKTPILEHALTGKSERRVLFGTPTWFVGGNIFAGVFSDDIFPRLTLADQVEIKELG